MSRFVWPWFKRRAKRAAGLVITSHRRGMLPTLVECSTTPALLDEIITEILGEESNILRPLTPTLFTKHRGNLRAALRELYDLYAAKAV
jgi:hypothetical protein